MCNTVQVIRYTLGIGNWELGRDEKPCQKDIFDKNEGELAFQQDTATVRKKLQQHNGSFEQNLLKASTMMRISSKALYHRYCPFALWITSNSVPFASTHHHHTVSALLPSQPQQRSFARRRPDLSRGGFTGRERTFASSIKWMSTSNDNGTTDQTQELPPLRVALCQFHVTEDKSLNLHTCSSYIDRAVSSSNVALVVLPEIWNSPYATAAFADYAEPVPHVLDHNDEETNEMITQEHSPSVYLLQQKAIQHQVYIVGGSIPEVDHDNRLYNTCIVFNPKGEIIAKHRKVHLFDISVPNGITFRESDTLSPGSQITSFTTPWCNIGIGICYDIRFPEYAMLLGKTCQVLIYPGAFNLVTGPAHWELLQRARAVDTQCYVLTASPARSLDADNNNDGVASSAEPKYPPYRAWGHSTAIAPWGDIIATTDEKESIVVADIDLTKVTTMRQSIPVQDQKRTDLYELESKVL